MYTQADAIPTTHTGACPCMRHAHNIIILLCTCTRYIQSNQQNCADYRVADLTNYIAKQKTSIHEIFQARALQIVHLTPQRYSITLAINMIIKFLMEMNMQYSSMTLTNMAQ